MRRGFLSVGARDAIAVKTVSEATGLWQQMCRRARNARPEASGAGSMTEDDDFFSCGSEGETPEAPPGAAACTSEATVPSVSARANVFGGVPGALGSGFSAFRV